MKPRIGITSATPPMRRMPGMRRHSMSTLYVDCVEAAGGLPWMLPNVDPGLVPDYLEQLDGLLLTGGDDMDPRHYGQARHPSLILAAPERDAFELPLARAAWEADLPLFCICRGQQTLAASLGGTLIQDVPTQVEGAISHDQGPEAWTILAHEVLVEPGTRLHAIAGGESARVNSFHHQALDRLPEGFQVAARASDGVIEAIEDPSRTFCLGVQWHPERRPDDDLTRALLGAFLEAAGKACRPAG